MEAPAEDSTASPAQKDQPQKNARREKKRKAAASDENINQENDQQDNSAAEATTVAGHQQDETHGDSAKENRDQSNRQNRGRRQPKGQEDSMKQ